MFTLLALYAFLLGAVIGSFLNVVIYRWPRELSVVSPPSSCPECGARIRWYDNVPLLSYLLLRARCRSCCAPIPPTYFFVELANALFYLALFLHLGPTIGFLLLAAIASMTLVLIYIDLDVQLLPDVVDIPGIVVGIAIGALSVGQLHDELIISSSLFDSLAGAALGALLLLALGFLYKALRKVEGMGLGDVKMLAMIGAVLGWRSVFPVLFIASFTGALFGLALAAREGRNLQFPIPFGVFLGIATFAVLFFGPTLLAWYRSLVLV
jgi:leader peptidase (prepilin peptidase) / N-methyltransferase